ncbi:carbohydrate kinase family protein [Melioribacteraceae bacterium 4301-Me]|uniref:carbohydrate kinase family protein n=1 Tax=Pyranulibacter aquaticus TaxID=3163344 RepID=UPI0035981EF0
MKILLIGSTILDNIESPSLSLKPGGVFYNTLAFSFILKNTDELFLLTRYNSYLKSYYSKFAKKTNFSFSVESKNIPEVYLIIQNVDERSEVYKNISASLSINESIAFNQFDGIFINMTTGFDITLKDLFFIRKRFNGLIYFDVHTLARGIDEKGNRNFKKIENAKDWLANVDIVQANENELLTLSDSTNEFDIANEVLTFGPKILIVTKAQKGARLFYRKDNALNSYFVKAQQYQVVNKIGCGDVFGTVFFYFYIATKNIFNSLKKAVEAGSLSTTFTTFEEYERIKNVFG